jgi:hypothetical protein
MAAECPRGCTVRPFSLVADRVGRELPWPPHPPSGLGDFCAVPWCRCLEQRGKGSFLTQRDRCETIRSFSKSYTLVYATFLGGSSALSRLRPLSWKSHCIHNRCHGIVSHQYYISAALTRSAYAVVMTADSWGDCTCQRVWLRHREQTDDNRIDDLLFLSM